MNLGIARELAKIGRAFGLPVTFKGSFDKANRSRLGAARGPGLDAGAELLREVREETGLSVMTDVHERGQARRLRGAADVIQIPAFLCRQTDLLLEAGASGLAVNIKKGQWMSPEAMEGAVEKVRAAGAPEVWITERGTAFGYGDLVVDMRSFARTRAAARCPVLLDATHAVQRPGQGADGSTGGDRRFVRPLALSGVAAGADGLFLEVHPQPELAPSDSSVMLRLPELCPLVRDAMRIRDALYGPVGSS